ncbi:MAG: hypothetical protein CL557_10250 [Alphaproteobacteria bacterium]|nr:hypothetical protein [Alphaproteobacteria bacterium]
MFSTAMTSPIESAASSLSPAERFYRRGNGAFQREDWPAAAGFYRQALELDPAHGTAWLNLGLCLRRQGHIEAAYGCTLRAQELMPDDPTVLTNLGNILVDLYRAEEAVACHKRAVAQRPDDIRMVRNLILALREAGRFEESLTACDRYLEQEPEHNQVLWERAQALFYLERYPEAWTTFEHRWQRAAIREQLPADLAFWQGEDLSGKTILVFEEQGFGDKILCARYIPLLAARGATVTLLCNPALHGLFSTLPGKVTAEVTEPEAFDYAVAMMSLPGLFGTDPTREAPPPPPPLMSKAKLPERLQQRLDAGNGRWKIGIVWSGNPAFYNNSKRAASVEHFLPLAQIPGVQLYSLQKGPNEGDLAQAGGSGLVIELGPYLKNFAQTAAILQQLDLSIMTDSGIAHLAGSLGLPIWNLLHYRPYWLYGSTGETTPWYPSMRLFRQPTPGDWDSVFDAVAEELKRSQ